MMHIYYDILGKNGKKLGRAGTIMNSIYNRVTVEDQQWVYQTNKKLQDKLSSVRERSALKIPSVSINGVHDNKAAIDASLPSISGFSYWTNGFWAGIMWLMYHDTKDERYAEIAGFTETILDKCVLDFFGLNHDIGYMWLPSAVLNYKLTGNHDAYRRGLLAADLLAGRFNPAGEFIRAWDGKAWDGFCKSGVPKMKTEGVAIIDCMLNLPLLYWASEETGDPRFKIIAMKHADRVMDTFIRQDGSVIHIVEFDPETGEYVRDYGGQGYDEGSSWTRGQAWGLYGFVSSYKHTGKKEYLDTAKKIAGYFISKIPENGLIPSDFCQPEIPHIQDDIAAGAASCGLIELAEILPENSDIYLGAALKMLHALDLQSCDWNKDTDGITLKGTMAYNTPGKNMNYVYGDYFFVEAILKLKGNEICVW